MNTRYLNMALGAAIVAMSFSAIALPCGNGPCFWNSKKVDFALTEGKDALTLSTTVQGCEGMRSAHQGRIAEKVADANKGKACCPSSPFAAKGLKYKVENSELGTVVTITGPAEGRAEFRKLFDSRVAARKAGTGCGCGAMKGSCDGCGKSEGSCACQKGNESCPSAKVEKKTCGCGK